MNEDKLQLVLQELEAMRQRNARVEADKAWETSTFRIVTISAITYVVALCVMFSIGVERFWLDALVPTIGFFLSSRSLPSIKRHWLKSRMEVDTPSEVNNRNLS